MSEPVGPITAAIGEHPPFGPMERLDHDRLVAEQQVSLASPRRRYSVSAHALFLIMDRLYGSPRSLEKFPRARTRGPGSLPGLGERRLRRRHPHRPPARLRPQGVRSGPNCRAGSRTTNSGTCSSSKNSPTVAPTSGSRSSGRGSSPRFWRSLTTSCPGSSMPSGRSGAIGSMPTSRTTPSTSTCCS